MERTLAFYINMLRADFIAFCNERLKQLELSQGLLYFLLHVGRNPGCSAGEMAQSLKADSGHTTRSIEKLVKQGFMTRQRSEQDKRAVELHLTEKGEAAYQQIRGLFTEWEQQRTQHMTQEETQDLKRLLQKAMGGVKPYRSPLEGGEKPEDWKQKYNTTLVD